MTKFKVGDTIQFRHAVHVAREIVEARETGYSFRFPHTNDPGIYRSEDSTDPLLEDGWEVVTDED